MNLNLKYASINAKLKGMNSKNLNDTQMYSLMKQNNLQSAIYFLKNNIPILKDLREESNLSELELELEKIRINNINKLQKYMSNQEKKLFNIFISKYEIKIIIDVLMHIINKLDINVEIINLWTKEIFKEINGITDAKDQEQFLEISHSSMFYDEIKIFINSTNKSLLEFNSILYKKYLEKIYDYTKNKNKELNFIIGEKIDLLNILLIYKMKNIYYSNTEEIKNNLININCKLNKNEINKLLNSINNNEFMEILESTYYKSIIKNNKNENLEYNINLFLYKQYKSGFNLLSYNINTIIYYMCLQDIQINNVIHILGGINYQLDKTEIEKKVII